MKSVLSQDEVLAFIYEPLVQGSRGMRMYSPEALSTILSLAKKGGVTCIADEVMTGFGRTGRLFASLAASPSPDLMCFSKGLTGGFLPLGITTATEDLFGAFLSQEKQKALLHGHSFTANPIACAAANASLDLLLAPQTEARIKSLADWTKAFATRLGGDARVSNPRSCGTIVAFEVGRGDQGDYFTSDLRDRLYHYYIERGVLLRPLGNTVYVLPPLCITDEELKEVESAIIGSLSLIGEQLS